MSRYDQLNELLGKRTSKKIGNNTYAERRDADSIAVRYHDTDVCTHFPAGQCVYFSGGWLTSTTKDRMNEWGAEGWRIYADKGQWYLWRPTVSREVTYPYADLMTVYSDGTVTGAGEDPRATQKLRKRIRTYAAAFVDALAAGDVPGPSVGDCFYCAMRDASTGQLLPGTDHYTSHFEEGYYVPSMLTNAIQAFPVSPVAKWWLGAQWGKNEPTGENYTGFAKEQLRKSLTRFLYRAFGLPA